MCQMIAVMGSNGDCEREIGTLADLRVFLGAEPAIVRDPEVIPRPNRPALSEPGRDGHCLCCVDLRATGEANGFTIEEEYPGAMFMEWRRN